MDEEHPHYANERQILFLFYVALTKTELRVVERHLELPKGNVLQIFAPFPSYSTF